MKRNRHQGRKNVIAPALKPSSSLLLDILGGTEPPKPKVKKTKKVEQQAESEITCKGQSLKSIYGIIGSILEREIPDSNIYAGRNRPDRTLLQSPDLEYFP